MPLAAIGILWAFAFVTLEAIQFVFFGGLFQRLNSYLFGFLVLGLTTAFFVGRAWIVNPDDMRRAFAQPWLLFRINVVAALGWVAYLGSVQLIEPAVAYTIGAGVMPLTALALYWCRWPEGERMRNRTEITGNILIAIAITFLSVITLFGLSGFVRGGTGVAVLGVILCVADGVLFTIMLAWCQRLDRCGVGPSTVFGLRFPLYVLTAGVLAAGSVTAAELPAPGPLALIVLTGVILIVPPLYALQKAVALIPTMTLSAITATGPFMIFLMQMFEGRVGLSTITLTGLFVYFAGAVLAAAGAVRASMNA